MKQRTENLLERYGKTIYINRTKKGWAIVIMPDEIRIDNYYKPTHLHLEQQGIHIPTKYTNLDTVGLIVECHLNKNKGINKEKLMEELI